MGCESREKENVVIGFLGSMLAFVFVFGIVVFAHECGHFIVAKIFRMRVLALSLGFGRVLWKFQRGETEYKICVLPLGGYVKLEGNEGSTGNPNDFSLKPRWQRLIVLFSGPATSVLLAVAVVAVCFMGGHHSAVIVTASSTIGAVEVASPAEKAGLLAGDTVVAIGGKPMRRWSEVHYAVMLSGGHPLVFSVKRGGKQFSVTVFPENIDKSHDVWSAGIWPVIPVRVESIIEGSPAEHAGILAGDKVLALNDIRILNPVALVQYLLSRAGKTVSVRVLRGERSLTIAVVPEEKDGKGIIGVKLAPAKTSLSIWQAIPASVRTNKEVVVNSAKVIGDMFRGKREAGKTIAGPIGIAEISGKVAREGIMDLLFWVGLLSMNLGILNLLPIPLMDGGNISILLIEIIARRDLPPRARGVINFAGLLFIVFLFVFSTFTDLGRIFSK